MRRLGLVLLALLSIGDVATLGLTDGAHPPYPVAALDALLGVTSLVLVVLAWSGRRWAVAPLVALRVVSALTALPAFVVSGVPAAAVVLAACVLATTALGILLVARPSQPVGAAS